MGHRARRRQLKSTSDGTMPAGVVFQIFRDERVLFRRWPSMHSVVKRGAWDVSAARELWLSFQTPFLAFHHFRQHTDTRAKPSFQICPLFVMLRYRRRHIVALSDHLAGIFGAGIARKGILNTPNAIALTASPQKRATHLCVLGWYHSWMKSGAMDPR